MGEAGTITVNGHCQRAGCVEGLQTQDRVSAQAKPGKAVTLQTDLVEASAEEHQEGAAAASPRALKLTLTARDAAGNTAVQKRTARLRR